MKGYEILFGVCIFLVFYTYIGYGILLYILVKIKKLYNNTIAPIPLCEDKLPEVTLFIAAYNEESVINRKMNNCLELDYPLNKLHILWITDGSNDNTNEALSHWQQATVIFQPERQGKTAALNRGMKYVNSPIVVFTDANTSLNREALRVIVQAFNNPKVGCVAGEKRIAVKKKDNAASGGEDLYWKYESTLKSLDSQLCSVVGAAGELFAIRQDLYEAMKPDTLLDDFMISLRIAMRGYKIEYCADAYAIESGSINMEEEEKRKIRITAGGLQSIWRLRSLLNPFKFGCLSFQYISHRVLRWSVTPVALFLMLPINIILAVGLQSPLYIILLALQLIFYSMGAWGYILSKKHIKNKLLFVPYYFLFMNVNVIKGAIYLFKRRNSENGIWEKAHRAD